MKLRKSRVGLLGSLLLVIVATAACNSSANSSNTSAARGATGGPSSAAVTGAGNSADASLSSKLPADIKSAGVIKVASDATYPPMEFIGSDGKTLTGFDIDLGDAIGKLLDFKIEWTNLSAAAMVPGLQNGRFDMALTAAQDLPERRAAFTFVDYFNVGSNLLVAADNPNHFTDFMSLCGHRLGVQAGTAQLADAQTRQKKCGSKSIDIQSFPTNEAAVLALSSGRVEAVYAQSVVNAYVMSKANNKYSVVGAILNKSLVGAVLPKNSKLVPAVQAAVQKLIDDGTYEQLLTKWNLREGAIQKATVNGS